MSAFVLTPQSPLCLRLPVLDWSLQNWHATAKLQVFKVLPQRYKYPHPSGVWIHRWDSRSRRAMTCVRNQAADTTSNSLEPGTVGTSLNSENVESYRLKEECREETKTDHAMATKLSSASKADAEQRTGNLALRLTPRVRRVAVIGAGAAGLVAARELDREGHEVVVYEQSDRVGGVWDYNPETEDDILGIRPDRSRVHSSMYKSLRTNLPRELMGFLDFPFLPKEDRDPRRFPGHQEVYLYLEDFAKEFDILQWVRFNTEVEEVSLKQDDEERIRSVEKQVADVTVSETHSHVYWNGSNSVASDINKQLARPNFDGPALLRRQSLQGSVSEEERREVDILSSQWVVRSRRKTVKNVLSQFEVDSVTEDVFDAVVVCNGHYSEPKIASIPGIEHFSGTVMHSHNYRVPTPFQGQVVVVIGSAPSGEDVSREVATVAKEVHVSARAWSSALDLSKPDRVQGNLWRHPMISCISNEGAVRFEDESEVVADTIIHCTGYKYSFPFLEAQEFVSVEDNRVGPLFQHVFPPALAPHLSFVGLPYKVVPFPLCELQSQWIAKILSGKLSLPSPEQMMTAVHNFYTLLEALGYPKHYTHNMDLYQYAYSDWLAEQCEYEVQGWREEMYAAGRESKRLYPTTYRDIWTDKELMNIVYSKLLQFQHSRPAMLQNI